MTFPVTEHTVKTNRHTTGYLACGAESAPLLIFCHGWPELSLSWRHQLPAMAALGFRCIAPDMRGYGRSSTYRRHEDFAQELIVEDMLELLASLGRAQGQDRAVDRPFGVSVGPDLQPVGGDRRPHEPVFFRCRQTVKCVGLVTDFERLAASKAVE